MHYSPELIDAVRRMKAERASTKQIAMAIGETESAVEYICHKHDIRRPVTRRIEINASTYRAFQGEAVRRDMKIDALLRKVLNTIATDNLYAAVLDDGK